MKNYLFKLLIFFTILILQIVLIEVFLRINDAPKISYQNIYSKSQSLIPQINSNTILFLGDSRIEWGIKPLVVNKILDSKYEINVINLAMPNSNGLDVLSYLKDKNIYPKLIILGYTSNYGRYTNHDLDKKRYSEISRIVETIKYFAKQKSFIYDRNSIQLFLTKKHPLHLNHVYDKLGGVNVTLYGDYKSKKDDQIKIYESWSNSFSNNELNTYLLSIKNFKQWFSKGGTKIYGLSMPTSTDLADLEPLDNIDLSISELFDEYFDYTTQKSLLSPSEHDSIYFKDGSHLTKDYANSFSEQFAIKLKVKIK